MPTSCSHKLQAIRDRWYPQLELEVHQVALTLDQVIEFGLPSTPLKGSGKKDARRDLWMEQMGRAQTEIDALAALRPADLSRIAMNAIEPFFDSTLKERGEEALDEWQEEAEETLKSHPQYEFWAGRIEEARAAAEDAAGKLNDVQRQAKEELEQELPDVDVPEAEIDADDAPEPIFTTDDDFLAAAGKLMQRKKFGE